MLRITVILFFIFFAGSESATASVEVAFFRFRDSKGQLLQLEPGGEFAHVAIRIGTRWLHAAPYAGVEFVSELAKIGSDFTILTNGRAQEIKLEEAGKYLGLRYDSSFDWSDTRSSYCSKLIANLLGIEPTPAHFAASHWRGVGLLRTEGAVGISPDEIFQILRKDGFQPRGVNTCEGIFHKAY